MVSGFCLRFPCQKRHADCRKAAQQAEQPGDEREEACRKERPCQQQDAEEEADNPEYPDSPIPGPECLEEVGTTDETGKKADEENKESEDEDGRVERVHEDQDTGDDVDDRKKEFPAHVAPVNKETSYREQAADKPERSHEGDQELGGDSRRRKEHNPKDQHKDSPEEENPPREESFPREF